MAVGAGFEPATELLTPLPCSKRVHSTALPTDHLEEAKGFEPSEPIAEPAGVQNRCNLQFCHASVKPKSYTFAIGHTETPKELADFLDDYPSAYR